MIYFWSFVERIGNQCLRIIFIFALARLLRPEDFATMGLVSAFIAIGEVAIRSGLGVALIREERITDEDKSTLFYFSCGLALALAYIFVTCARTVPTFASNNELRTIIVLMSSGLVFNAISAVSTALLMRENKFDVLAKCTLLAQGICGLVAIVFAFNGAGVWSLVIQQVCGSILSACATTLVHGWLPKFAFSMRSLRRLLPITVTHLASNLGDAVVTAIYYGILSKAFTSAQVGYYNRAKVLQESPVALTYQIISRPCLRSFACAQTQQENLKQLLLSARGSLFAITLPAMIILAVGATDITRILLGNNWISMSNYLALSSIAGCFYPLYRIVYNLMSAIGNSRGCLEQEIVRNCLLLAALSFLIPFGLEKVIIGQGAVACLTFLHSCLLVRRSLGLGIVEQLWPLAKYLGAGIVMLSVMLLAKLVVAEAGTLGLVVASIIGSAVYLLLGHRCGLEGIRKPIEWAWSRVCG